MDLMLIKSSRELATVLVFSSFFAAAGCNLYRSDDRENFNTYAVAGAPKAEVALVGCTQTLGALEGSELEAVRIQRERTQDFSIVMAKRLAAADPYAAVCHLTAELSVTRNSDHALALSVLEKLLTDASRPLVEHYLRNSH